MKIKIRQKIKPRIMPYAFCIEARSNIRPKKLLQVFAWTVENFGDRNDSVWISRDNSWNNQHELNIYFMNEEDAAAFKLRWL